MPHPPLSLEDEVNWSDAQLATEVEGEVVLLSIENGAYYGLDDIGSDIWRRLSQPVKVSELCAELSREYRAEAAVIQRDVLKLLERMLDQGLVTRAK